MGVVTATLAFEGALSVPLVALFVARDAGLIGGTFLWRYKAMKEKKEKISFDSFFDLKAAKVEVTPSMSSKLNTAGQIVLVLSALASHALQLPMELFIDSLSVMTATTTVMSGYDYWKKGAEATVKKSGKK
mmetsp:Transcript_32820/g.84769  ORF Transcript_32820/g.84769 Transcript_32820/m.84769 type:complete len:131 (+) Transcript_32820:732-1124(+)